MKTAAMLLVATSSIAALAAATPAIAQVTPPTAAADTEAPETADSKEIVITGTQIRGIAGPVGSNVIALSEKDIQASGATNSQQLLATLPQTSSFNNPAATMPGQGVTAGIGRVPVSRPNVRRLPGCAGSGTGACTLILFDGHRAVPAGLEQIAVDPGIIPPGIIQRVETILDGNSAIYGSDAIGGVINFIPRKRYNGLRVDGRYGFADNYKTMDANIMGGIDWGSGSVIAAYSYGHNDALFGRDRSYIKSINWNTGAITSGGQTHLQCDLANVTSAAAPGITFGAPSLGTTPNLCDPNTDATLFPENTRHTGYVSLSQDLSDALTFDLQGLYSDFRTRQTSGPFTAALTINGPGSANPATINPFFQPIPGRPTITSYTALFSFNPAFGNESATNLIRIKSWQVTPNLTADFGKWQLRALGTYGKSRTIFDAHAIDTPALNAAAAGNTTATALNPFNIAATNAAVLANINDFHNISQGLNTFYNARAIADGPLFEMESGQVRASVGVEWMKNKFKRRTTNGVTQLFSAFIPGAVESKSVFGELFVPFIAASEGGVQRLDLSVSGRYDHYDQGVGGTFNPKVALTFEPTKGFSFRGNWGKSFNAPTAADRVGAALQTVAAVSCGTGTSCGFVPTGTVLAGGKPQYILFLSGTVPGLEPQTATNWSVGVDLNPPPIPGLSLSLTYYNITIKNFISLPQTGADVQQAFRDFPELITTFPAGLSVTPGAVDPRVSAYLALATSSGPTALATVQGAGGVVVQLGPDNRVRNLGISKVGGLDFMAAYRRDVGFGSIDLRYSANLQLRRDFATVAKNPFVDTLLSEGIPAFVSSTVAGANIGDFRAQATWNHTSSYRFTTTAVNLQDKVGNFDTLDLFFRYALSGSDLLTKDLTLTFNVNNVLDAKPPVFKTTNGGTGVAPNIRTLGRTFLFGIQKGF